MDPTTTERNFFARKMTFGQLLTSRLFWGVLIAGGALAAVFLIPQLSGGKTEDSQESTAQRVYVKTIPLVRNDQFTIPIWYSGEVQARRKTNVGFQRGGKVVEILCDEGDYVEHNQVIARLDSRQLTARAKQLAAETLVAKARLDELRKGPRIEAIRTAAANVDDLKHQRENAELDLERARNLRTKGAVSQQEYDQSHYLVQTLNARIDASEAQLEELKVGTRIEQVDAAEALYASAQAASELAKHDLDDCTLRAPYSGTVIQRMVDDGAVLDTGRPVVRLVESNRLELNVGLPVQLVRQLVEGQAIEVEVDGAHVSAIVKTKLLALDPMTRTQTVVLELAESAAHMGIVDSQMGRVKFETVADEEGFVLPVAAIVNDQQGLWSCFTVELEDGEHVVKRQSVEVLHFQGDFVFVRGTIQDGETIVSEGLQRLTHGLVVRLAEHEEKGSQ